MLKLLTLNTWQKRGPWQKRWQVIFEGMEKYRPQVAAFQEVFEREWASDIQKRAGMAELVYGEAVSGLAFLSSLPVKEWDMVPLKSPSLMEQHGRFVLYMKTQTENGEMTFFNTHLSWRPEDGEVRKAQVGELLEVINEKAENLPALVTGDFNAPAGSEEIEMMSSLGKFLDVYALKHPGKSGFTWDYKNPYTRSHLDEHGWDESYLPPRRIDYIFFRPSGEKPHLQSADIIFDKPDEQGFWASDHLGLLAQFE